jgi:DNA polymerase V
METITEKTEIEQMDLFSDYEAIEENEREIRNHLERENKLQKSILSLQQRFGKNAILKGMNLQDNATQKERNATVGGHKA